MRMRKALVSLWAHLGQFRNCSNVVLWVTYAFDVDRLGLLVDSGFEVSWVVTVHKLDAYAILLEGNWTEQSVASPRL